jgi:iron complex outermembrane receptor protein
MITTVTATRAFGASSIEDLSRMSLQELGDVEVTSVSKAPEPLHGAPAALYVITHEAIVRSGANTLPEVLRLAPNLTVSRTSASGYVITARGFGGDPVVQNFSNKLLVLIDGRSVYTPLFSGVYWDAQDLMLEDIDRIEVISGPGATLWGANAVNGVINIITRAAADTDGDLVSAGGGNLERDVNLRHGTRFGNEGEGAVRVYGKAYDGAGLELPGGANAGDAWHRGQGGFRADWSGDTDRLTAQGDLYHVTENTLGAPATSLVGANALGRWQHDFERSELQFQAYFDDTQHGPGLLLHTYDLEMQQTIDAGTLNRVVWGAGERVNRYAITSAEFLLFIPEDRTLTLGNAFVQDTVTLARALHLTLGAKLEDDPYSGEVFLPEARLAWEPGTSNLLWAAASRAVRSATPFDVDVVEKQGPTVFLTGNPDFQAERVTAYEVGYRGSVASTLSLSISGFYNDYDHLRTIETAAPAAFLPLHWGNLMAGPTYGVEAWGSWQVTPGWQLSASVRTLRKNLRFEPGASGLLGLGQAGDDPSAQGTLSSSLDLGRAFSLDATLRYVAALPDPSLPAYCELNTRFAWHLSRSIDLALSGQNLLHARHLEYPAPYGEEIPRSVFAEARWRR